MWYVTHFVHKLAFLLTMVNILCTISINLQSIFIPIGINLRKNYDKKENNNF